MSTAAPDGIGPRHIRPDKGRHSGILPIIVLGSMLIAAFFGLFGGKPSAMRSAGGADGEIGVAMPATLRSGMFFEMTITARAHAPLADATIAMSPGLWRSMTVNTTMPQAGEEDYANGMFRMHYGPLQPGQRIRVKIDGQINPDLFGGNGGDVALFDGERRIATTHIATRVLP